MLSDTVRKYPFLDDAFPVSLGFRDWGDFLDSADFPLASAAAEWILRRSFGLSAPPMPMEDRFLHEGFHVAVRILGSLSDEFLIRRFSVRESKKYSRMLELEPYQVLLSVAERLGLPVERDGTGYLVPVPRYLVLSRYLQDPSWYLVNQELRSGRVVLDRGRFVRLLEVSVMLRIESLALGEGPDISGLFPDLVSELMAIREEARRRFRTPMGRIDFDAFPPCMKSLLNDLRAGKNVPHSGRFAIVTFLHALGMENEQILELMRSAPDFNERVARYQIEHITGKISAKEYAVPKCATMLAYGLCPKGDPLCDRVKHPLQYYRIKRSSASGRGSRTSGRRSRGP